jgi:hypothetical protein
MNALQFETANERQSDTNGSHGEILKPVTCRFCAERLRHTLIDVGMLPLTIVI